MQKLFAIAFSLLVLFQSINFSYDDVSKINTLLEHAEYHHEAYGDSFFQFLAEHYGDEIIAHENEHKEHDDLPFKHHHQTCAHSNIAFTFETLEFDFNYDPFLEIPINFFYKEGISSFEKLSVFQPPKLA